MKTFIICCSVSQLYPTVWDPMDCRMPGFPVFSISQILSLLKFMSFESMMSSNQLILYAPFSFRLQSFPASGSFPKSWFFTSGGQSIKASASVLPMNIQDWFPLGLTSLISMRSKTLKSLLQPHSSSILWCSTFFMVQHSQPCITTGKTIALIRQTFVGKLMPLLFNMLSKFVIFFLPRSKQLLISWLQSPSAVILEPKKIKSVTVPLFPQLIAMKRWDQMPWS